MKVITPKDSYALHQENDCFLIDVREEDEFAGAHIEGAKLVPLSIFPQAITQIDLPKDKKIIFYCAKGARSARAIEFLEDIKFTDSDLYNMEGGITEWVEDGLPVKTL